MGYLLNECMVVFCWDLDEVKIAHAKAKEIFTALNAQDDRGLKFETLVSDIIPAIANGGGSFMIGVDGSKEGWTPSTLCERGREEFILFISTNLEYVDWSLITLGGDDNQFKITKHTRNPLGSQNHDWD